MRVITGPVLGTITPEQARVLIEVDEESSLALVIEPKDQDLKEQWTRIIESHALAYIPCVMVAQSLRPGTAYSYTVMAQSSPLATGDFYLAGEQDNFKILCVSCNAYQKLQPDDTDMFGAMEREHDTPDGIKFDALYHIGDQIYEYAHEVQARTSDYIQLLLQHGQVSGKEMMDIDGKWCFKKDHLQIQIDPDRQYFAREVFEICTDMFKCLYRWFWNQPSLKRVLSRVSNEMIWDDHDIRNGWGMFENDHVPHTIEFLSGRCAYRAYLEYQVQLFRSISPTDAREDEFGDDGTVYKCDYRVKRRGNSAIFLMDVRTPRSFLFDKDHPYVGIEQMNAIRQLISDPTVCNLMVICSVPIIFSSNIKANLGSYVDFTNDIRDQWSFGPHAPEHKLLLQMLFDWRRTPRDDGRNRSLMFVGGDVHFAVHTTIREAKSKAILSRKPKHEERQGERRKTISAHPREVLAEQVVTSPINNEPNKGFQGWCLDVFAPRHIALYGLCSVKHDFRAHRRNYAAFWIEPLGRDEARQDAAGATSGTGIATAGISGTDCSNGIAWRYALYIDREPDRKKKHPTRIKGLKRGEIREGYEREVKPKTKTMKPYSGCVMPVLGGVLNATKRVIVMPFTYFAMRKKDLDYLEENLEKQGVVPRTKLPHEIIVYPPRDKPTQQ